MKFIHLAAFVVTLATTVMASPLFEERGIHQIGTNVNPRDELAECKQVDAPYSDVDTIQTERRDYGSGSTDIGKDSLFSYARPAVGSTTGVLTITNALTGRKVIQFLSGLNKITFEIYGRQDCRVSLTLTEIDGYKVWQG